MEADMKEIFSPFKSKEKLLQIVICALIFIGMAVPFKVMVLIKGLTEVRPVNAVPIVAGLLLGPAGAWGCALGNLIADGFGTFSQASALGFIGNFIAAYLPYKLWHITKKRETPNVKSSKNIVKFILIAALAALATAIIIACGLDVLFGMWIPSVFWIIFFNDLGFSILIGLPVFIVLTSEESTLKITLPERCPKKGMGKSDFPIEYLLLSAVVLSELVLLWMISLGMKMSAFPLMAAVGGISMLSLLILLIRSDGC